MARTSRPAKTSTPLNCDSAGERKHSRDEVLKRMLKMKPQPQKGSKTDRLSQQEIFADSEDYSDANISKGNRKP